eukprot:CAMPEP_0117583190 /NCGR_PEP_ID=MMETSP0784-20121206/66868_1 /TAXON_ID=39447 /ORGANISM="" /LENGTH=88 /DNA_ID=CAMNT_0005383831 /DNA_START=200 /DNA_END=466 /DNA_ORIENTATION=+
MGCVGEEYAHGHSVNQSRVKSGHHRAVAKWIATQIAEKPRTTEKSNDIFPNSAVNVCHTSAHVTQPSPSWSNKAATTAPAFMPFKPSG